MNIKHFIKTVLLFSLMIGLGLLGVFLLGKADKVGTAPVKIPSATSVAK